jgi:hypothetical protein
LTFSCFYRLTLGLAILWPFYNFFRLQSEKS